MKLIKKILCMILFLFLLVSCKNSYIIKNIDGINYINIFNNYYYRIDSEKVEHFYRSGYKGSYWTKLNYTAENFAKISLYFTCDKETSSNIARIRENYLNELITYYNIDLQDFEIMNKDDVKLLPFDYFAYIKHEDETMVMKPENGLWKKGYDWLKKGASTEIKAYFVYKEDVISYCADIEYLPVVENKKQAEELYQEYKEEIQKLFSNLYF